MLLIIRFLVFEFELLFVVFIVLDMLLLVFRIICLVMTLELLVGGFGY